MVAVPHTEDMSVYESHLPLLAKQGIRYLTCLVKHGHHRNAWREIEPVPAPDEYGRAVEDVLLPMEPIHPPERHDPMSFDCVRPARAKFPRCTDAQAIAVLSNRCACGKATDPPPAV